MYICHAGTRAPGTIAVARPAPMTAPTNVPSTMFRRWTPDTVSEPNVAPHPPPTNAMKAMPMIIRFTISRTIGSGSRFASCMYIAISIAGDTARTAPTFMPKYIRLSNATGSALWPCLPSVSFSLTGTNFSPPGIFFAAVSFRNISKPRENVSAELVLYKTLEIAKTIPKTPPIIASPIPCSIRPAVISATPRPEPMAQPMVQRSMTINDFIVSGYKANRQLLLPQNGSGNGTAAIKL